MEPGRVEIHDVPKPTIDGGNQAEFMKYEPANSGLVKIPGTPADYTADQLASLQTLSDVMATGFHAAKSAEVKEGDTVAVIGDGAVGRCGVIGAIFCKLILETN